MGVKPKDGELPLWGAGMSKKFPSQELDKFIIRLPGGMRERIGAAARANNRSMNAEIVSRLEQVFPVDGDTGTAGHLAVKPDTPAADVLIELQHQQGQIMKMIEDLPNRLGQSDAGKKGAAPRSSKKKP